MRDRWVQRGCIAARMPGRACPRAAGTSALILVFGAAVLSGCGEAGAGRQPLNVFAASSLTEAFQDMETSFESAYPGTDVVLVFAGSQILRLQIEQGAHADIFASANARHAESLERAGLVGSRTVFAGNELVVIVPPDNPAGIESFGDLPGSERLVIGTEHVPAGAYAREALHRATGDYGARFETEVLGSVVSEESNVRLVRAKVELGVADAAIVYRTDATPGRVRMIPLPPGANVRARYEIGTVTGGANPGGAERWLDFVASAEGQEILARRGFLRGSAPAP